jgi:hypothetical protein
MEEVSKMAIKQVADYPTSAPNDYIYYEGSDYPGAGWTFNENAGTWVKPKPNSQAPSAFTLEDIKNRSGYAFDPNQGKLVTDSKDESLSPSAYYTQLAKDLSEASYGQWSINGDASQYQNLIESLKEVDPKAYYTAKIDELSRGVGHQYQSNQMDRGNVVKQQLQDIIPEAQKAGLTPEEITSISGSGYSAGAQGFSQILSNMQEQGGSLKPLVEGIKFVGPGLLGMYGIDAALTAGIGAGYGAASGLSSTGIGSGIGGAAALEGGSLAASAGGAGSLFGSGGTAALSTADILGSTGFTPTAGGSFAIDPTAAYTTAATGTTAATTGTTGATTGLFGDVAATDVATTATTAANTGVTQALPYTEAFDAANLFANGITDAGQLADILTSTGMDSFLATDMARLAVQGLSASQIASTMEASYTAAELAKTGTTAAKTATTAATTAATTLAEKGLTTADLVKAAATAATTGASLSDALGKLLGGAASIALTAEQKKAIVDAYNTQSSAISTATKTAADKASFTPVGMTTAFGSSNFTYDPVTGKIVSAGYTPTAKVSGQIDNLFNLGTQALPTTTDTAAVQQNYINQQLGLLSPTRAQDLANLQTKQYGSGTSGLATGGTMAGYTPNAQGLLATNPAMAAYYNSIAKQNAELAARAPTYAQELLDKQIATGTNLFGAAKTVEGYAKDPFTMSTDLAKAGAAAGANSGQLTLTGATSAAELAARGTLMGNASMQGIYNEIGKAATAAGQSIGDFIKNNATIQEWLKP